MWATDRLPRAARAAIWAAATASAGHVGAQPAPRIDRLPSPAASAPQDLGALSRDFGALVAGSQSLKSDGPVMLVFISFAMPEKTLDRLIDQASRIHATLVLRGMVDGSLTRTAVRARSLLGSRRVAVQIDPQAFDRYAVAATPSFVLVARGARPSGCGAGACATADGYVLVAGDVSIDYALRYIERSAPRFAKDAKSVLLRLHR